MGLLQMAHVMSPLDIAESDTIAGLLVFGKQSCEYTYYVRKGASFENVLITNESHVRDNTQDASDEIEQCAPKFATYNDISETTRKHQENTSKT
jgi:hypothetical protein